jgi:mRNA-degrading endonuclease toxin of MazEF toxin-antitoxin module
VRGTVYRLRPPTGLVGHEQSPRFAIVVQTTRLKHWRTWIVVPTSSSPNAHRGLLRPVIDFGHGEHVAMIDAIRPVDPEKRLGEEAGHISPDDMTAIEKALAFVLDLP